MKLFGTDGIRGKYGVFPLDNSTVRKIGAAISEIYTQRISKFFIAHDGRSSHKAIYLQAPATPPNWLIFSNNIFTKF